MDQNEYKFAKDIVNLDYKINKALEYVQENFGVKAEYDEENFIINLSTSNINEGLQLIAANDYIKENLDSDFVTTNID
jgi:hypothetical protein